jgi:hypothetical protein
MPSQRLSPDSLRFEFVAPTGMSEDWQQMKHASEGKDNEWLAIRRRDGALGG